MVKQATLSVAHEVRAIAQAPSRLCPHCAQPFRVGRHNQRFCDALCKRRFGRRLYQQRRQEAARSERTAAGRG